MYKLLNFILAFIFLSSLLCAEDTVEFPVIPGWLKQGNALSYNSANLWEYINGAADQFIDYDFVQLRTCDLARGELVVTIEIYEMESVLCAFGIYSAERPSAVERISIGGEGVILPPGQALFFKDKFYVKIYASDGELNQRNGYELLSAVSSELPGIDGVPEELFWFPQKNKKDGTEGYVHQNFSGLTELSRCIFADYSDPNGHSFRMFYILPGSEESIEESWQKLAGGKWQPIKNGDKNLLYREVPYKGFIGVKLGIKTISGVANIADLGTLTEILRKLESK